jgi:hypothetical protein
MSRAGLNQHMYEIRVALPGLSATGRYACCLHFCLVAPRTPVIIHLEVRRRGGDLACQSHPCPRERRSKYFPFLLFLPAGFKRQRHLSSPPRLSDSQYCPISRSNASFLRPHLCAPLSPIVVILASMPTRPLSVAAAGRNEIRQRVLWC